MAYIYKHIRLDKNEPFYIGIGSDNCGYKRAYSVRRSQHWKYITNKTNYIVEIIEDNLTWEQACEKEKEYIALYGRKDLNLGPLVNKTDGGEGIANLSMESREAIKKSLRIYYGNNDIKRSEYTKQKMSRSQKGRKKTQNQIDKHKKCIIGKKASNETKKKMSQSRLGKITSDTTITKIKQNQPNKKNVCQIDIKTNEIIKIFNSINEASQQTRSDRTKISACCNEHRKTCNGYKWKFLN